MAKYNQDRIDAGEPLLIPLRLISLAFSIASHADELVANLLKDKSLGSAFRELIIDLREFEMHTITGGEAEESGYELSQDLLESNFLKAELRDGVLRLWDQYAVKE